MGPVTVFDKSALQALSMDEAVWFDAFFYANVVPVFHVETLADLEKEVATGRTPEDVVGLLAEKTPYNAVPNVHHRQMVLGELAGHSFGKAMMFRQAVINAGDPGWQRTALSACTSMSSLRRPPCCVGRPTSSSRSSAPPLRNGGRTLRSMTRPNSSAF